MHFLGFVNDSGSGVCGEREGLVWLGLVEKCGYSEIFGRDLIVLVRGSHSGS